MMVHVGQQVGNYRIIHQLRTGGFADVYLGEHCYLNTQVVIKFLHTQLSPTDVEDVLSEARHLNQLMHPHIIRVLDFGIEEEIPFLVMDYAPGGTLRKRHPKGEVVNLPTVVSYVNDVASALKFVHEHGLIHLDLKPENLFIGSKGQILLSDFGIALLSQVRDAQFIPEMFDALAYMAPEQIRGKPQPASDQYALALLVYEWLCGGLPFAGSVSKVRNQHLFANPGSILQRNHTISSEAEQVVFRALSKDPENRFPDIQSFAEALAEANHGRAPQYAFKSQAALVPRETNMSASINQTVRFKNLPAWLIQLVGREEEKQAACALLERPEVRLLTMTGTGGIGKTRLASQVAADLQEEFTNGVCFIQLAAIQDPDLVIPTIAHTLGLYESDDQPPMERLTTFLRDKHLLLLLDNFEQVLPAAPLLSHLISFCPLMKVLVTSRSKLHIQDEFEFLVKPLALPDLKHPSTPDVISQYSAVELFVRRAQAVQSDFQLTRNNAHIVAQICVRLDGLPLAIELAAARIKLLSFDKLYSRLEHQLTVLTAGNQDAPLRQQTLRNTLQWSYDLLTGAEQRLFRRCCVFIKSFTLEAAEFTCNSSGDLKIPIFDLLASLVDKSLLLQFDQIGVEPRLYLLTAIREFGIELLSTSGELELMRIAHASYYLHFSEDAGKALAGSKQVPQLELLKPELENIRSALHFLLGKSEIEASLRLSAALQVFWMQCGHMSEGRHFLEQGMTASQEGKSPVSARVIAQALYIAGWLAYWQNEPLRAAALLAESEQLSQALADKRGLADTSHYLGNIAFDGGDLETSTAMHTRSLRLYREIGDRKDVAKVLLAMGSHALYGGDFARASELCNEGLALVRETGNAWQIAVNLHFLGWSVFVQGDYQRARKLSEESVAIFETLGQSTFAVDARIVLAYIVEALGDESTANTLLQNALALCREMKSNDDTGRVLCGLGHLSLREGNLTLALSLYEESIALLKERWVIARNKWALASCLEGVGEIMLAQRQCARTVQLFAVAESKRAGNGYHTPLGIEQPFYDQTLAQARAQLGKETFAVLWAEAESMTLEQVLKSSMNEVSSSSHTLSALVPTTASDPIWSLTRRELEVLHLLAQGLTNTQIAKQLIVSLSTVDTHIRSIYGKLGVSSRVKATRYAIEHQLLA